MSTPNPCKMASPATGQLCTMTKGHAGPHHAGGPYHSIEAWVTQCPDGKCDYHGNRSNVPVLLRWQECIYCGHKKPSHVDQYLLETPGGSIELFAADDSEAVSFANAFLNRERILTKGLKLFRYPKEWVNRPTTGLIEVPFYQLTQHDHSRR